MRVDRRSIEDHAPQAPFQTGARRLEASSDTRGQGQRACLRRTPELRQEDQRRQDLTVALAQAHREYRRKGGFAQ